jgi:apolipoprotein N-acyltransferase
MVSPKVAVCLRVAAAVVSGGLLALAFPPFTSTEAAWFALVPLILCARAVSPRTAFGLGWLSGFVFWLITLGWLLAMRDAGGPLVLVLLSWLFLSAVCAVYSGVFTSLISCLWHGLSWTKKPVVKSEIPSDPDAMLPNIGRLFAIPLIWVGCEYLRSTLFTGFAWNALGVSQYANLVVIQFAEFGGVYVVSALCMLMNAALALTGVSVVSRLLDRRLKRRVHPELMIGLVICGLAWMVGYRMVAANAPAAGADVKRVRVAAIQSNIPQGDKWQAVSENEILQTMYDLTEKATLSSPDLIIWPETAMPKPADRDPVIRSMICDLAGESGQILVGTIEVREQNEQWTCYNSAILFNGDGPQWPYYRKTHLVPFGEYIPGDTIFPALERLSPIGYSCKPGLTNTVFKLQEPDVAFSALICFEDTIASLSRYSVRNGAQFLVNLTNDAWFEGSWAGWQHMAHCVFRCVENRVPAVRCANFGVSCYIARDGKLDSVTTDSLSQSGQLALDYRVGEVVVPIQSGAPTVYNRFGDLPFALPCGTVCALLFMFLVGRGPVLRLRAKHRPGSVRERGDS